MLNTTSWGKRGNPPLVFIHGFMGSSEDFNEIAGKLEEVCHCIIPDLPGHGDSLFERGKFPVLKEFLSVPKLLGETLHSLGLERYSLYGYSMGGRIAAAMAVLTPGRIDKLILESSSFGIEDLREREERYGSDLSLLDGIEAGDDFRNFLARWYSQDIFKTLGRNRADSLVEKRWRNDPRQLQKALKLMSTGNQPYLLGDLAGMDFDIGYIFGTEDPKYRKTAAKAAKKIPGIRLFPVEGASHNVHLQFPDKVAEIIRELIL